MNARTEAPHLDRRRLLVGGGALVGMGLVAKALELTGSRAWPSAAAADPALDTSILQTATSLEILLVKAYDTFLALPFLAQDSPYLAQFCQATRGQHDQHRQAMTDATTAIRAKPQTAPDPRYAGVLEAARPTLTGVGDVAKLAAVLEEALTETYLSDITMMSDAKFKGTLAKIMGAEAEHLALLRTAAFLFDHGLGSLVKAPLGADVAKVPPDVVGAACPDALQPVDHASPTDEGAVK